MPFLPRDFAKKVMVIEVSLFYFKYCIILIYRLRGSYRAGFVQVTVLHTSGQTI